jgi:hypothetical protein
VRRSHLTGLQVTVHAALELDPAFLEVRILVDTRPNPHTPDHRPLRRLPSTLAGDRSMGSFHWQETGRP